MNPLISIVIPCLNSEKTIQKTLNSILAQTYPYIECLVQDGKSQDRTTEIVRKNQDRFGVRLRFESCADRGVYYAMNRAIQRSQGSIVCIVGTGDSLIPSAVETAVEAFNQHSDLAVYHSGVRIVNDNDEVVRVTLQDNSKLESAVMFPHLTTFVKKTTLLQVGGFDTQYRISADFDLMLKIKKSGAVFLHSVKILGDCRAGGLSDRNAYLRESEKIRSLYRNQFFSFSTMCYRLMLLSKVYLKELIFRP